MIGRTAFLIILIKSMAASLFKKKFSGKDVMKRTGEVDSMVQELHEDALSLK